MSSSVTPGAAQVGSDGGSHLGECGSGSSPRTDGGVTTTSSSSSAKTEGGGANSDAGSAVETNTAPAESVRGSANDGQTGSAGAVAAAAPSRGASQEDAGVKHSSLGSSYHRTRQDHGASSSRFQKSRPASGAKASSDIPDPCCNIVLLVGGEEPDGAKKQPAPVPNDDASDRSAERERSEGREDDCRSPGRSVPAGGSGSDQCRLAGSSDLLGPAPGDEEVTTDGCCPKEAECGGLGSSGTDSDRASAVVSVNVQAVLGPPSEGGGVAVSSRSGETTDGGCPKEAECQALGSSGTDSDRAPAAVFLNTQSGHSPPPSTSSQGGGVGVVAAAALPPLSSQDDGRAALGEDSGVASATFSVSGPTTPEEPIFQVEFGSPGYDYAAASNGGWQDLFCSQQERPPERGEGEVEGERQGGSESKSHSVVRFLNQEGSDGSTALFMAVYDGNVHLVDYLLAKGADPYFSSHHGNFFHSAVLSQSVPLIRRALQLGCSINEHNVFGNSPLTLISR